MPRASAALASLGGLAVPPACALCAQSCSGADLRELKRCRRSSREQRNARETNALLLLPLATDDQFLESNSDVTMHRDVGSEVVASAPSQTQLKESWPGRTVDSDPALAEVLEHLRGYRHEHLQLR